MKTLETVSMLLFSALVSAAPGLPSGGWIEGKWWKNPRAVRDLGLTAAQSDRIEEVFLRVRPALIDLRADMEKKRLVRDSILERPTVDPKEAARAIDALGEARSRLDKARALMLLEIRQILTSDQREKIAVSNERLRERRRPRMGRPPANRRAGGPAEEFDEPH
jgi:Spy/CpxP family protein refolding chaperone